jgi:serine/threonine-protein kinase
VAGLVVGILVAGIAVWSQMRSDPVASPPLTRFAIQLPEGDNLSGRLGFVGGVAISPDGKSIAYVARRGGSRFQLYLRRIDQIEPTLLEGTEEARHPFFSPDSQWVGFSAGGELQKVSVAAGSSPLTICDAGLSEIRDTDPRITHAIWEYDDTIFFSYRDGLITDWSDPLCVSASGGEPEQLTDSGRPEWQGQIIADVLPEGKGVLFGGWADTIENSNIGILSLETGEWRILLKGGIWPTYVSTGHIVYEGQDSLMAVPFDLEHLELTGPTVPVLQDIRDYQLGDALRFSLSRNGSLVYFPAMESTSVERPLFWIDRRGNATPVTETLRLYREVRLSPDGRRLAVRIRREEGLGDVWVLDLARDTMTRLTFGEDSTYNVRPLWSPDCERIFFTSNRADQPFQIFWKSADGSGDAVQLTTGAYAEPTSISSDGKILVFNQFFEGDNENSNIGIIRIADDGDPEILLDTPFSEYNGMLSPDDRWLAYVSNESGRDEVYVRAFPDLGGRVQVSTGGGREPMWSRDGHELFYRNGYRMMAVPVSTYPEIALGEPILLFEGRYAPHIGGGTNYDVAADGRFVMVGETFSEVTRLHVVLNWFEN